MYKLTTVTAVIIFFVASCSFTSKTTINEPERLAEIGDPLVFDGRRLLKELSERRLQIEREISNATVQDIETTASIAATTALDIGISAATINDQPTIDLFRSSQAAGVSSNNNSVELQNLTLDKIRLETAYANELVRDQAQSNDLRLQILEQQIASYSELLPRYKEALAEVTGDDDEAKIMRAEIVAKIDEIRKEMNEVSKALQGTPSFTVPEKLPTFTTPTASPVKPLEQPPKVAFTNNSLDKITAQLKAIGGIGGTRAERFQQYQSYLDELYATKNSFLIDDYHSRLGYRMVRVVFPIYVPPSDSNSHRKVAFNIRKGKPDRNARAYDSRYQNALLFALNRLSLEPDDNLPRMSEDEISLHIALMLRELDSGYADHCPTVPEERGCTFLKPKCFAVNNAARTIGLREVAEQCIYWDRSKTEWVRQENAEFVSNSENSENGPVSVFSINPKIEREKIDKATSRLFALGASVSDVFGGASSLGSASIGASYVKELFAQASSRTPVIASFTRSAATQEHDGEFGWWVYPRVTIGSNNKVKFQHTGTQFYGTVDLSVPVSLATISIESIVEGDPATKREFELEIPNLTFQELVASSFRSPIIDNPLDYGTVSSNKMFKVKLSGMNLWKHPEVVAGGKRADKIEFVAGSSNDIIATFNNLNSVTCDYNPNSDPEFTYRGKQKNPDEYCAIRIMLHTADGKDFAGSALIKKSSGVSAKAETKPAAATGRLSTAKNADGDVTITVLQNADSASKVGDIFSLIDKRSEATAINQIQLAVTLIEEAPADDKKISLSGPHLRNFCIKADGKYQAECPVEIRDKTSILYRGPLSFK